ncbi:MAG: PhnA domain-containing protein [Granulosicoccaceae bacterium]
MTALETLQARSGQRCELCGVSDELAVYAVAPHSDETAEHSLLACSTCRAGLENPGATDNNHWRCLNDSMWSEHPPVQVAAWRMLNTLGESWAQDLLEMLYLDDQLLDWAKAGLDEDGDDTTVHRDSNGAALAAGDTVILIKDLPVKGANFTAKRGTAVRGISLVPENAEQIEGRVNSQRIVILTQYVKKQG